MASDWHRWGFQVHTSGAQRYPLGPQPLVSDSELNPSTSLTASTCSPLPLTPSWTTAPHSPAPPSLTVSPAFVRGYWGARETYTCFSAISSVPITQHSSHTSSQVSRPACHAVFCPVFLSFCLTHTVTHSHKLTNLDESGKAERREATLKAQIGFKWGCSHFYLHLFCMYLHWLFWTILHVPKGTKK